MRSPKMNRVTGRPRLSVLVLSALMLGGMTAAVPAVADEGSDAGLAAMGRLAALEGEWEGTGWMQRGPGEPERFRGSETVRSMLGGRVMMIEGKHRAAESDVVVHHALALVSWNAEKEEYRLSTYLSGGQQGDFTGGFDGDDFRWSMQIPGQEIRYILRFDDDRWFEIGERSGDGGETWHKFLEMDLERVSAKD